jgi:hypothetical protein
MMDNINKFDIDHWVENFALSKLSRFYPSAVANDTELSIQFVFERLLEMVKDEKLKLYWEVRCPNYGCFSTLKTIDYPILGFISCESCGEDGEEIEITNDNIFPIFSINQFYRDSLKKKLHKCPI